MAILPIQLARVSNLLMSNSAIQSLNQTQQQILTVQNELTTGKRVNVASDDPSAAAVIQQLQKTLDDRQGYTNNVNQASTQLGEVDSTLSDLTDLLQQATQIASQNVSSTVSSDQRASAAAVVDSIYQQAMTLANKQFGDAYLFGGDRQTNPPYVQTTGGMQYVGSTQTLQTTIDTGSQITFQVSGQQVFGGLSSQVVSTSNLAPQIVPATRLSKLQGATGGGIAPGSIQIGNGIATKIVDLSDCDTVGDVLAAINGSGLANISASLTVNGFQISATGGANVTVGEVGGGSTASDLGILNTTGNGPNATLTGANVGTEVTEFTLVSLTRGGLGIDPAGFTITNGQASKAIAVTPAMTVNDLMNEINGAGIGVTAQLNATSTGINIFNSVQGTQMSISENGGTTATDLGIRSFTPTTPLSGLNDGVGVRTVSGNDFNITTANGSLINVDLNNPVTVQDVLNQINAAAGGSVTASFATTGNGILITDNTSGAGTLKVNSMNGSSAAADLGLTAAATGNQIVGTDVNGISTPGVFSDLQKLRDSLRSNDQAGITTAAGGLQNDSSSITTIRGQTGAVEQQLQSQLSRLSDENTSTQALLSQLQDVDYPTAITQFQSLQTSLQAALQTAAKSLNLSLMDYLT